MVKDVENIIYSSHIMGGAKGAHPPALEDTYLIFKKI